MLLADLEQPGGTLTTPFKAPTALLLPIALALFPIVLPAGLLGKRCVPPDVMWALPSLQQVRDFGIWQTLKTCFALRLIVINA